MFLHISILQIFLISQVKSSDECTVTYQLDENNPIFAFPVDFFWTDGKLNGTLICLKTCADCDLFFDVTRFCILPPDNDSPNCPPEMGLRINGEMVKVSDCKTEVPYSDFGLRTLLERCTMELKGDQHFDWLQMIKIRLDLYHLYGSSFAVRVKQWIDPNYDYQLEAMNMRSSMDISAINITYPKSPRPIYVILPLQINQCNELNDLRSDDPDCSYDLFIGMPPGKTSDGVDRRLCHYEDKNSPFATTSTLRFSNFLESSLYNILIPPNCSPHLSIEKATIPRLLTLSCWM
ncbi:unnamed protein product, partial [Mesorhabditis belari]|uniref:Uncharacterized protein n=1 Tax=Mesorhabditis belari TaxID=2138241 RepID=A0AAF3FP22_9BILA